VAFKEVRRPSGLQAIFPCPKCGDKDFAVSLETGAYKCFSENKCGIKGSYNQLRELFGDTPEKKKDYFLPQPKKQYKKPEEKQTDLNDAALQYLKNRGVNRDTAAKFRLSSSGDTLIMPSYRDGKLVTVKYRSIKEKKFWNEPETEPILFGMDTILPSEKLLIVEGHFDAMAMDVYGTPAVSVPNGVSDTQWIELCWDWLDKFEKIYLCFDNDPAGQSAILDIATRLGRHRCYSVILPFKDANDCLMADVSHEEILQAFNTAHEFTHENIVPADYFADEILKSYNDREKNIGVPTSFSGLNKIIKGWRSGEFTVWTGNNGAGKTTAINIEALNLFKTDHRCCIASLEMPPVRYLRWMILQNYGHYPSEAKIAEFMARYGDKLYIFNSTRSITPDILFDAFSFAARKYNVKYFFLDSLMKIKFGKEEYKEQKEFCADIKGFCEEHRCHFHMVAHPRKGQADTRDPDKMDVAGSGHITDLADNVVALWRADQSTFEKQGFNTKLTVKKNREYGIEGSVFFTFDETNKQLTEIENFQWKKTTRKVSNPEYFQD